VFTSCAGRGSAPPSAGAALADGACGRECGARPLVG
jgi:hypothetical protein